MLSWQITKRMVICLLLAGCAHSPAPMAKPSIPQTQAECIAKGGSWTTLGLPMADKLRTCDLKATDSGKSCTDSSECQGICVAPPSAQAGSRVTGQCSVYLSNFGNIRQVTDGVVEELNVE
jgi:hypothetical protein